MYDVIIIGGGVSGCSAAIYTAFGKLKTLVIDAKKSQIIPISQVVNYPGIQKTTGEELLQTMKGQALENGADWLDSVVTDLKENDGIYNVVTANNETYEAKYIIIATNINTELLERLGFVVEVNDKVPSGKIKRVQGVGFDGKTSLENVFIAGLLANLSTQCVIAAGQGAQIGVDIVSKETGKAFVWHDL
ncbi:NAD(P)/FAD-dependent oxidoreductase [Calidifontibacillus oryziterrae]|uniref:NAD(P)/FAD-dependent oxidoreductase n=1 Tax=Calidifontibacillus oryziterrae TaxID=1191699 RepID=UPI0002D2DC34|nr:NAD(P)/FAD-dependent oxidoreductase [Calidifontibacillus oryziterrae]